MDNAQMLIINSDDLGHDSCVNKAILKAFEMRLCSSASIMANMTGFEEAVEIAHENRLLDATGVHIVLTEGRPLSDEIKKCRRFCNEEGEFVRTAGKHCWLLSKSERNAVIIEMCKQIERCREHGLQLTHMDSHHQVHHAWGMLDICIDVAKYQGIRFIRPRGYWIDSSPMKRFSSTIYNSILRRNKLTGSDFLTDVGTFLKIQDNQSKKQLGWVFDIMIHPTIDDSGNLIDAVDIRPLYEWVTQIQNYNSAISYSKLNLQPPKLN